MTLNRLHYSTKWLGVYLLVVGLYHVGFYSLTFNKSEVSLYLEPRFYSDLFLFGRIGEQNVYALGIGIGIWLAALGSLFIAGKRPLITYTVSEVLLFLIGLPAFGTYTLIGLTGGGHAVPDILFSVSSIADVRGRELGTIHLGSRYLATRPCPSGCRPTISDVVKLKGSPPYTAGAGALRARAKED
ncbi:MAG: hypothetical protein L0Z53_07255 [Acidobacteriales bacterium]|nr:hypothetical protein [Terriglobales bacterium]